MGFPEFDEPPDGVSQAHRMPTVLEHGHTGCWKVHHAHRLGAGKLAHVVQPQVNERAEPRVPFRPIRRGPELAGALPRKLPEGAREGFRAFIAGGERHFADGVAAERQAPGRAPHPHELHVAERAHPEESGKLAMEVVSGEGGHAAHRLDGKRFLGTRLDELEHTREALLISLQRRWKFSVFGHAGTLTGRLAARLTDVAVPFSLCRGPRVFLPAFAKH
jgi:hypothetical protein